MATCSRTGEALLATLVERTATRTKSNDKMAQREEKLKVGDIVIVISPDSPRAHWPLAKVTEVFPGKDGKVRVAQVQLGKKLLQRPVTKLCLLEHC